MCPLPWLLESRPISMTSEEVKKQRVEWCIGKTKKYNTHTINMEREREEPSDVELIVTFKP